MTYQPELHHRKTTRLKNYDYSQCGIYFITICIFEHKSKLGKIENQVMVLNQFGNIVLEEILKTEIIRPEIKIHDFVIMPNHLHLVIEILNVEKSSLIIEIPENRMKPKSISSFVSGFKAAVTVRINKINDTQGSPFWQRNYYDNIIRNEKSYNKVMQYIKDNPIKWTSDKYYED